MSLCRICLTHTNGECVELFSEHGRSLNMVSILSKYFWFQIIENDEISTIICSVCWNNTNNFHQFYSNVQQAQQQYFRDAPKVYGVVNGDIEVGDGFSKCPSININEFPLKVDDFKILLVKTLDEKKEIQNTKLNDNENEPITDEDDYHDDSEKSNNDSNKNESEIVKTNITPDLNAEDQKIAEFCQMFCDFCRTEFKTLRHALKHYKDKHQIRGYLICGGVKLNRRYRILNYINRHKNPQESHCNICNKSFCDKEGLKRHMNSHKREKEKFFKCVGCDKRFANSKSLTNHKLTVHGADENRNIACDQCNQKFFTKLQLVAHVKRVHNSAKEICDFCGKEFRNKYNLNIHRSEIHLGIDSPKSQCNICGIWLKQKYLTKHLKRRHETKKKLTEPIIII